MSDETLPTFLIIGAMKGGTSSLYEYLRQHPDVFASAVKEPSFFIDCAPHGLLMPHRGRRMFRSRDERAMFRTLDAYRELFTGSEAYAARFEASTSYLCHPPAARHIKEMLPEVKLVVLLRDPVDRAYSAYTFHKSFGYEPASTFEDALAEELAGERDDWWYAWRHLHYGLYSQHIDRYRRTFGEQRLLVLSSDAFFEDPTSTCRSVFRFVGVDPAYAVDTTRISNQTRLRSPLLTALYRDVFLQSGLQTTLRSLLPTRIRRPMARRVRRAVEARGSTPPRIPDRLRSKLREYFAADIERLAGQLDWDPRCWR